MSLIGKKIIVKGADFSDIAIDEVEEYVLNSIAVTTNPTKQVYEVGDSFEPTGMIVTASLTGNVTGNVMTKSVTDYTYSPTSAFTETGVKTITISYTLNGITKTTTLSVQVNTVAVKYDFTASCTNGTISPTSGKVSEGGSQVFIVTPNENYKMPTQVACTGGTASISGNQVTVSSVTDDVTLSVVCEALALYTITGSITNGQITGASTILEGSGATVTINPTSGYDYPNEVNVIGATFSYLATSGVVTLNNPTDNVVITATCPVANVGDWMSNIMTSSSTAHSAWENLSSSPIYKPTSLKYSYSTTAVSVMQEKIIKKIATKNPGKSGVFIDFYTADDVSGNSIVGLSEKLTTVNLNSNSIVEEYNLSTPILIPAGKTLVLYISDAFDALYRAQWETAGKANYVFEKEPSEGLALAGAIAWSAFDFYLVEQ